jgi:hypothetical protein
MLGKLFGFIFGGIFRAITTVVVLLLLAGIGLYAFQVHHKFGNAVAPHQGDGVTYWWEPVGKSKAGIELSLPFTARVIVKESKDHNWMPLVGHGLVKTILVWSPGRNEWLVDQREGLSVAERVRAETIIKNPLLGSLIDNLEDEEMIFRCFAHRELRLRTENNFGYDPHASATSRMAAVAKWQEWWDENKLKYSAEKVLDLFKNVLD